MAVFLSYSHADKEFADRLALELVKARAHVWLDRWELRVGDSLTDRIQAAIDRADALLVVLTKASVQSAWCRRELNAGLVRELEESRVLVLPVVAEECDVPLFLRDKIYADFRGSFEEGLKQVLRALADSISTTLGRVGDEEDHLDYGVDWWSTEGSFVLRLTIVQAVRHNPYTILTEVVISANDILTRRYQQYAEAGVEWVGRGVVFGLLQSIEEFSALRVLIEDDLPAVRRIRSLDPRTGIGADITITCRRLGAETGMDILVAVGATVDSLVTGMRRRMRPSTEEERRRLQAILATRPGD